MQNQIVRKIERQDRLENVADSVHRTIGRALDRAPSLASALHGDWLGHPLHAALTDVPTGSFTAALVLDALSVRDRRYRRAADATIGIGLAGSMVAAVAGLADFSTTRGGAKRVGFVHGTLNAVTAGLYGASFILRKGKRRRTAVALSTAGYGLLLVSAWLGGELAYRYGVGVRGPAAS